ncbi:hypothetical protein EVA_04235 [gut metagenome]|uniref:Uncharacterized protein n=1 Tax=gut metagenome TaxID=749906 RepID=J9GX72_9ZZZZ
MYPYIAITIFMYMKCGMRAIGTSRFNRNNLNFQLPTTRIKMGHCTLYMLFKPDFTTTICIKGFNRSFRQQIGSIMQRLLPKTSDKKAIRTGSEQTFFF